MWERMKEKRNEGGFTLIELLIVIIILAILAAIVVFAVGTTGSNAKAAACNADAKTFETALESYKAELGLYPPVGTAGTSYAGPAGGPYSGQTLYGLDGNPNNTAGGDTWSVTVGGVTTTYGPFMRAMPGTSNYLILTDGNGGVFVYTAGITPVPTAATMDGSSANNFDDTPSICATVTS
jgi:prepilin-type N-terminal cleavage/methylation domain-containing protein